MHPGFAAVKNADVAALRSIVAKDRSTVTAVNEDGQTLLIFSSIVGSIDAVRILLDAGAQLSAQDVGGRNALLWAAAEGNAALLALFLSLDPGNLDPRTKSGNTPLHRAAAYGQISVVRKLIEAGVSVNAVNAEGATPLSRAARWGHADAVAALLEARADPNAADSAGKRPLDWALAKGFADVAALLKSGHAPSGSKEKRGAQPQQQQQQQKWNADGDDGDMEAELAGVDDGGPRSASELDESGGRGTGGTIDDGEDGGEGMEDEYVDDDDGEGSAPASAPMRVEGWMAKQGHIFRNWKNRWFVLDGRSILYYSKEGATKPRGVIQMVDGSDIIIEERYAKPFCFTIITPAKRFVLQAADEDEMAEWLMAIQNNLECVPAAEMEDDAAGDDD